MRMNYLKMISIMLRSLLFCSFFLVSIASKSYAVQFRLMLGPKVETASSSESSISNTNPISLIFEYDSRIYKKYFISIGASGEFDLGNMSSTGFGLYGSLRYYIKGDPSLISSAGKDIQVSFVEPISYFIGLGFFQKNISFDSGDPAVRDIKEDVGGLIFSGGGNYSLSKRYYLAGYLQYLFGGAGSSIEYTSIEGYGGIGMRF